MKACRTAIRALIKVCIPSETREVRRIALSGSTQRTRMTKTAFAVRESSSVATGAMRNIFLTFRKMFLSCSATRIAGWSVLSRVDC